jgi:hypothetical protein
MSSLFTQVVHEIERLASLLARIQTRLVTTQGALAKQTIDGETLAEALAFTFPSWSENKRLTGG